MKQRSLTSRRTLDELAIKRKLMKEKSGCKNPTDWCGRGICKSECAALIFHGPGHQSKTHCQLQGPHPEHYAELSDGDISWTGMKEFAPYLY